MPFTLLYAGQAIGRVYDGIGTLGGGTGESIREKLLALTAEMRANLALADAAGAVVETRDLMIMDPVPPGLDPMGVLTATIIHVGAVLARDAIS